MLDGSRQQVLVSGKQSWCLVNTDAIDLTAAERELAEFGQDLGHDRAAARARCGSERSSTSAGATRTTQYVAGQAFDITDLPNGTYYVRVHVNPLGAMFESNTANNVEDRLIRLRGKPGHRRVVVPPWHGIDTENVCSYCF